MMPRTWQYLIDAALVEDIGAGDVTTEALIPSDAVGNADMVAKEPLVVAGLQVAEQVFHTLDPAIVWNPKYQDGDQVQTGAVLATVSGNMRNLLIGERTALNFLQRLCGIATNVRSFVNALGPHQTTIRMVDTRKTIPGWRILEKYAVRVGGGHNHRFGLFDGILIKDNHIAACGGIANAVARARKRSHHLLKIEVEVDHIQQVQQALDAGADVIMLDNMNPEQIREAVGIINGKALVEVSGNVKLGNIRELADTGIHIISSGALTHSARFMDISMKIQNPT